MDKNTLRILMYIVVIVLGIVAAIVGGTQLSDPGSMGAVMLGAGCATVATGIYAWIRGLGPLDMDEARLQASGPQTGPSPAVPPGFRGEWYDMLIIAAFYAVGMGLGAAL